MAFSLESVPAPGFQEMLAVAACCVIDGKTPPGCRGYEPKGGKHRREGKDFILSRNH